MFSCARIWAVTAVAEMGRGMEPRDKEEEEEEEEEERGVEEEAGVVAEEGRDTLVVLVGSELEGVR